MFWSRTAYTLFFLFVLHNIYAYTLFIRHFLLALLCGAIGEVCIQFVYNIDFFFRDPVQLYKKVDLILYAYFLSILTRKIWDMRNGDVHIYMLFCILLHNSISDILQYIVGKLIGRTRLWSDTTNKTLEGYIAGLVGTPVVMHYIFPRIHFNTFLFFYLNVAGMTGGYINSCMKRELEIKDWSGIFGPHGGINDRLDSWVLASLSYLAIYE